MTDYNQYDKRTHYYDNNSDASRVFSAFIETIHQRNARIFHLIYFINRKSVYIRRAKYRKEKLISIEFFLCNQKHKEQNAGYHLSILPRDFKKISGVMTLHRIKAIIEKFQLSFFLLHQPARFGRLGS